MDGVNTGHTAGIADQRGSCCEAAPPPNILEEMRSSKRDAGPTTFILKGDTELESKWVIFLKVSPLCRMTKNAGYQGPVLSGRKQPSLRGQDGKAGLMRVSAWGAETEDTIIIARSREVQQGKHQRQASCLNFVVYVVLDLSFPKVSGLFTYYVSFLLL